MPKVKILLLICLIFNACKQDLPATNEGMDWHYGLDTYKVFYSDLKKYGNSISKFIEVSKKETGISDTAYISGTQVDWKKYLQPFLAINMYTPELGGKYKMYQNIDTNTKLVTINYVPLFSNLPIEKMIVTLDMNTSDLKKVYAETTQKSALTSIHNTITYMPGIFIQVIKQKNNIWKQGEKEAFQLNFILNEEVPQVDIINE